MAMFETKVIEVSKFNFLSCWRLRILTELSAVNVCFKVNLYFMNWQFNELLKHFAVLKGLYAYMCIVCGVKNARNQTFYRELSISENNFLEKSSKVSQNS